MAYLQKNRSGTENRRAKLHYGWKCVDISPALERADDLPTELLIKGTL